MSYEKLFSPPKDADPDISILRAPNKTHPAEFKDTAERTGLSMKAT